MKESTRFVPTNKLKEYDVVDKNGEGMGKVQTFVVDMLFGRIAFAMVSFGGVFNNDKWFAMPWETLKWSIENKKFILDMPKEVLEKATGMDKDNWLDQINFEFVGKSYTHFGVAPYWESSYPKDTQVLGTNQMVSKIGSGEPKNTDSMNELTRFVPTNMLKEYDVVNKKGEAMGEVQTFVADMLFGRIAFAMVSFGGVFSNDKWFAMPWETLKWSIENKKFILDKSKDVLKRATGIDKDKWLDQINLDFVAKSYTHFGVAPYWESSYPKNILSIPKDRQVIGTNQMVTNIPGGEQKNTDSIEELTRFVPTNLLKDYHVVNKKGEAMGEVQTFVADMLFGRIAFAMVSFGGVFSNDKWFAMPWEVLKWSIENKNFILDMPKEVLEKATGMDKDNWLDQINLDFVAKSYTHFGVAPYWENSLPAKEQKKKIV